MRLLSALLTFGVVGALTLPSNLGPRSEPQNATIDGITKSDAPRRFIIEFAENAVPSTVVDELTRSGVKVLKLFSSEIFTGAAVESTEENIDTLQAREPIYQAWHSNKIQLSPSQTVRTYAQEALAANYTLHDMTGVDKLHAAGVTGKGVTIAVVDTGIDYNHPALGGGFGPKFKVVGGYDFVGDGTWANDGSPKTPDSDPMDQMGHGTHVAGIIAGSKGFFKGVAPDAKLMAYKVFGSVDGTDEETLIEAFLAAYHAGVDIITCSVGGPNGWMSNAWALVASRIVEQGVLVTIAAGNSGSSGAFTASNGAVGENVVAVASVQANKLPSTAFKGIFSFKGSSDDSNVAYQSAGNWTGLNLPIVPLSFNLTIADEACKPLIGEKRDFSKSIVLVRQGTCTYTDKQANLAPYGAKYVMFYSNQDPDLIVPPTNTRDDSITSLILAKAGAAIIKNIQQGGKVTANFMLPYTEIIVTRPMDSSAGHPNWFNSMGPTNELVIKPDIAAPGGYVLSTYPGNTWALLSGTSQACPYVAGVAALFIGKHGGRKAHGPRFAKSLAMRLISSGRPLTWDDATGGATEYPGFFAPVVQTGTGIIDAVKVLNYDTSLSFAKFNLNDTQHFNRYQKVDISNNGDRTLTYTFSLQDYGAIESLNVDPKNFGAPRLNFLTEAMVNPIKAVPQVSFPRGTFQVRPGETKTAEFSFSYPKNLNPKTIPIYSGCVVVTSSSRETLSIPYMGVAADLKSDTPLIFPTNPVYDPAMVVTPRHSWESVKNVTFDLRVDVQDFLYLHTQIMFPTTELRWDIFQTSWKERDWVYPPVPGKNGYIGAATHFPHSIFKWSFDPSVDDPKNVVSFPLKNLRRTLSDEASAEYWWLGGLANGKQLAPGKYKVRIAALLPFATGKGSDSWDILDYHDLEVLPIKK